MRIRLTAVQTNCIAQKCSLNFRVTLRRYVCLHEASIPIDVSLIADLEDGRMEVHSFVWWVIQWSVCN